MTDPNVTSNSNYMIDPIIQVDHRHMIGAPEGSAKTTLLCAMATHVAAGESFLGMPVTQAPVLMIYEDPSPSTLETKLERFANGLGIASYHELPIEVLAQSGYRFYSKTNFEQQVVPAINRLLKRYPDGSNLLITTDSVLACLGVTSHGSAENQDKAGKDIKNAQDAIMNYCNKKFGILPTFITCIHSKKDVANYPLKKLLAAEMQVIIRGHGGLIGLNCDTGFILMKASEKPVLSGIIIIKCRKVAIDKDLIYFRLEEERYGKGPARLITCNPIPIPPTELEASLYSLFINNKKDSYKERALKDKMALHPVQEVRLAIDKLLDHKAIKSLSKKEPFSYMYNKGFDRLKIPEIDGEYRRQLREKYVELFK